MFSDCAKHFKGVKSRASGEETEKSFTELLVEELKQREEEATQAQQEADVKLLEAKKLASQYQKEADKCSSGMDTCEEAREKSAVALVQQKKLTSLWEQRARISISMQLLAFLPQFFLTWAKDLGENIIRDYIYSPWRRFKWIHHLERTLGHYGSQSHTKFYTGTNLV